ncbi:MAG: PIN domain-containing protein [Cyanobacteria bacterium]|nr:PIN domain-containing protein [Cyanobacteriota bacterium]
MEEITNNKILIDTDIIIDHLRGIENFLDIIKDNTYVSFISAISVAEIYSFLYPHEYEIVKKLLEEMIVVNVDSNIAKFAGSYRMKYLKSHSLSIADALIASSAKFNNAALITKNIRHFPMEDIKK